MTLWKAIILTGMFCSTHAISSISIPNFTYLNYSATFQLSIKSELLNEAIIFNSDGPAIKFKDGKNVSAFIITNAIEGLSNNFDLQLYPQYLLGIKSIEGLAPNLKDKFENSRKEINYSLDTLKVVIENNVVNKVYYACNQLKCTTFFIKNKNANEILMVNTNGFTKQEIHSMVTGS